MNENHQNEQYFFDSATVNHLADFVAAHFKTVCCLCTPTLGQALLERGLTVTILDIDTRFAYLSDFQIYDLNRPIWLEQPFDLIICDPPFFNVSLQQLRHVLQQLSHYQDNQPMLVSYLTRRGQKVRLALKQFGLTATGYFPRYETVQFNARNEIEFFGNLDPVLQPKLTQISK